MITSSHLRLPPPTRLERAKNRPVTLFSPIGIELDRLCVEDNVNEQWIFLMNLSVFTKDWLEIAVADPAYK